MIEQMPDNCFVLRQDTSWVCHKTLLLTLRFLHRAVERHAPDLQPVLVLDTCPSHLHKPFLQAFRARDIWVFYVQACMTPVMQPLDTHAFAAYKRWRQRRYAELQQHSDNGRLTAIQVLLAAAEGVQEVFNSRLWKPAFTSCGYTSGQHELGDRCTRLRSSLQMPEELPACFDQATLSKVLPKNRTVSMRLLDPTRAKPARAARLPQSQASIDCDTQQESLPWSQRVRSASRACSKSQQDVEIPRQHEHTGASSSASSGQCQAAMPTPAEQHPTLPRGTRLMAPNSKATTENNRRKSDPSGPSS